MSDEDVARRTSHVGCLCLAESKSGYLPIRQSVCSPVRRTDESLIPSCDPTLRAKGGGGGGGGARKGKGMGKGMGMGMGMA